MEKELNIAAILKDKPVGTKLYSPCCGVCTKGNDGSSNRPITLYLPNRVLYHLLGNGKEFETGEIMVYPSKAMQDWSKFAWKKGDVLVSNGEHIIFEKWKNNSYTTFLGVFDSIDNNSLICLTSVWEKETNEAQINKYISQIEKAGGGKLNLSTLEIEKPQFKDGDIVSYGGCSAICKKLDGETLYFYASTTEFGLLFDNNINSSFQYRPAKEEEKQQLFSALEKNGKAWDAEKKQIVDLPKKCEFKAFDKVLVRDTKDEYWRPAFFASLDEDSINEYVYCLIGDPDGVFCKYCIPYNDQTAHLLGTTDDWKGGEG